MINKDFFSIVMPSFQTMTAENQLQSQTSKTPSVTPGSAKGCFQGDSMTEKNRVEFQKPDLEHLTSSYTVVDMHFHSHYSDGTSSIDQIAQRARQLGIGLALTDHNEIRGALEINTYQGLMTIPGIEITTSDGPHILIYFYEIEELEKFYHEAIIPHLGFDVMSPISLTVEQTIAAGRDYNCLVFGAHPYCATFTGICNSQIDRQRQSDLLSAIDGVEVLNASNLNKWNLKSTVLGFNLGKAMIGGSDGHSLGHMAKAVSYAACRPTRRDFLDSIRDGRSHVIGKEIPLIGKVTSNGRKLRSNISNCPDLLERNIRYGYALLHSKSRIFRQNVKRKFSNRFRQQPPNDDFGF